MSMEKMACYDVFKGAAPCRRHCIASLSAWRGLLSLSVVFWAAVVSLASAEQPGVPGDAPDGGSRVQGAVADLPVFARVVRWDKGALRVSFATWSAVVEVDNRSPEKRLRLVEGKQEMEFKPADYRLEDARGRAVEQLAKGDVVVLVVGEKPVPDEVLRCLAPEARIVRVPRMPATSLPSMLPLEKQHPLRLPKQREIHPTPWPPVLPPLPRGPRDPRTDPAPPP